LESPPYESNLGINNNLDGFMHEVFTDRVEINSWVSTKDNFELLQQQDRV